VLQNASIVLRNAAHARYNTLARQELTGGLNQSLNPDPREGYRVAAILEWFWAALWNRLTFGVLVVSQQPYFDALGLSAAVVLLVMTSWWLVGYLKWRP
jgi:hypothetical protein